MGSKSAVAVMIVLGIKWEGSGKEAGWKNLGGYKGAYCPLEGCWEDH